MVEITFSRRSPNCNTEREDRIVHGVGTGWDEDQISGFEITEEPCRAYHGTLLSLQGIEGVHSSEFQLTVVYLKLAQTKWDYAQQ